MPQPKLIGVVNLDFPYQRKIDGVTREQVSKVAFDTDGQAWGLVVRLTDLGEGMSRINYNRWIGFAALPFVDPDEESLEIGGWQKLMVPRG